MCDMLIVVLFKWVFSSILQYLIGLVASGDGVFSLLLDDDSLVITGVVRRIHYFFLIIAISFHICCNAHAVLICLIRRNEEERCK